jgi:hypothetical protein
MKAIILLSFLFIGCVHPRQGRPVWTREEYVFAMSCDQNGDVCLGLATQACKYGYNIVELDAQGAKEYPNQFGASANEYSSHKVQMLVQCRSHHHGSH